MSNPHLNSLIADLNETVEELETDHGELAASSPSSKQLVRVACGQYLRRVSSGYRPKPLANASFFASNGVEAEFVASRMNQMQGPVEPVIAVTHEEAICEVLATYRAQIDTIKAAVAVLQALGTPDDELLTTYTI